MGEFNTGDESSYKMKEQDIYLGDSIRDNIKDYRPFAQPVAYGTNVKGVLFDGYPQVVKHAGPTRFTA